MNTLRLFNAVVSKNTNSSIFISEDGIIIDKNAMWAKDNILAFIKSERLDGNDLNKTFHKSWDKVKNSTRFELYQEQILHYLSTYGSDFNDEVYIPSEVLDIPELKLSYKVIKAYTISEMTDKCLSLLKSGVAMKGETIDMVLATLVDELGYKFTGSEGIRNKEAVIKIADMYHVLPSDTMEFFRYIIFKATADSLLIKSDVAIEAIKNSSFNPSALFESHGLDKLSQIFNRFKPLFLAFKNKCPKTINKISKLSKVNHKPLVTNPLNLVTSIKLTEKDNHWLDNATPFALFKAIQTCYVRKNGQTSFVHRIRNGKSWTRQAQKESSSVSKHNYKYLKSYLKGRYDMSESKVYLPSGVDYALPTSEKMYVGNVPTGTKIFGDKLAVGVYWENAWGANDIDLSGINIGGKIGWNSDYSQRDRLIYSGDMTNAPKGAVEYLYASKGLSDPTLVMTNIFYGSSDCGYKIIVGKGDKMNRDYMMNPNNLKLDLKTNSVQHQTVLGMFIPEEQGQSFVILNFGSGKARVSGNSELSNISTKALYQQWRQPYTFNKLLKLLGAEIVDTPEEADIDLSLDKLEKDSFTRLF